MKKPRNIRRALLLLIAFSLPFSLLGQQVQQPTKAKYDGPVFRKIEDVPGLPRVLLIGDSISIGYTEPVRGLLEGKANVHRIPVNAGNTRQGVESIGEWLGAGKWDVIHFNFGLHDIRIDDSGYSSVPIDEYGRNLQKIVDRLRQTGAALIWATTTPAPSDPPEPVRRPADVPKYNEVANKVMTENGIAIEDLYASSLPNLSEWQQRGDVHFTPAGYEELAKIVTKNILGLLQTLGKEGR